MRGIAALRQAQRSTRALVASAIAVLLLGALGGTAWALDGTARAKSTDWAATYHVTAVPGDEDGTTVTWPGVGRASMWSLCLADWDPASGTYGVGMKALGIRNDGRTPIAVATGQIVRWLQPGESDAFFVIGQVLNEQTPDPKAAVDTFAILSRDGASATGVFAWSAWWRPSDHTGHCTFTLQMKG